MNYNKTIEGTFLERPNRFIARVKLADGSIETVHVKNTGRCRELLVPGYRVILADGENPARKTRYDLVKTEKPGIGLINMDSQAPNEMALEWFTKLHPTAHIRREVTFGNSRFDICMTEYGKTTFVEVKGVTLERDGVAMFPDAPTKRGVKHIRELCECVKQGYGAAILFVIQMKGVRYFTSNDETHAEFGAALREASSLGVEIMAVDCIVDETSAVIDHTVEVSL